VALDCQLHNQLYEPPSIGLTVKGAFAHYRLPNSAGSGIASATLLLRTLHAHPGCARMSCPLQEAMQGAVDASFCG
jgi:hypothetical protein